MIVMLLGLAIFFAAHCFTMARARRAEAIARLGEGGYKGLYTLVSLAGLVLIVWGYGLYRSGGYIPVWNPPAFTRHIALLLMWPAMILLVAANAPGEIKRRVKNPMLLAFKIWAFAHLLANGDLGSIILFGAFLAYGVVDLIAVKKRAEAVAVTASSGWGRGDLIAIVGGTVFYAVFAFALHPVLIGVPVLSR